MFRYFTERQKEEMTKEKPNFTERDLELQTLEDKLNRTAHKIIEFDYENNHELFSFWFEVHKFYCHYLEVFYKTNEYHGIKSIYNLKLLFAQHNMNRSQEIVYKFVEYYKNVKFPKLQFDEVENAEN